MSKYYYIYVHSFILLLIYLDYMYNIDSLLTCHLKFH